jgi:hypothetical protein
VIEDVLLENERTENGLQSCMYEGLQITVMAKFTLASSITFGPFFIALLNTIVNSLEA